MSHNELHCRTSFSHPFAWSCSLLLSLFYELDLSFYFVLTKSFVLTQPENNAADRQISIRLRGGKQSELFLEHSMITAAVRDALESTLIIEVQLSLTLSNNHFTVVCSVRKG